MVVAAGGRRVRLLGAALHVGRHVLDGRRFFVERQVDGHDQRRRRRLQVGQIPPRASSNVDRRRAAVLQHVEIVFVVVVGVVGVVFAQVSNVSLFNHLHREGKLGTSQFSFSSALGLKMKQNKK